MPRRPQNDPLGTSDQPLVTTDPARIDAGREKFVSRLHYVAASFRVARAHLGRSPDFNDSLARLKRALKAKRPRRGPQERLHLELEMAITYHARKHAAERTGSDDPEVIQADIDAAATHVASIVKPRRGRPDDEILRFYVEAIMALLQETSGKPVRATRYKDNHYEPQFAKGVGETLVSFFKCLDPAISTTTLANYVIRARRRYAGRPMRFRDFFPLCDSNLNSGTGGDGTTAPIVHFEPNILIYCP